MRLTIYERLRITVLFRNNIGIRNSFTWDNETFAINQDYECHEDCIRTKDDFLPELILPMSKLSESFDELIAIMGYGR